LQSRSQNPAALGDEAGRLLAFRHLVRQVGRAEDRLVEVIYDTVAVGTQERHRITVGDPGQLYLVLVARASGLSKPGRERHDRLRARPAAFLDDGQGPRRGHRHHRQIHLFRQLVDRGIKTLFSGPRRIDVVDGARETVEPDILQHAERRWPAFACANDCHGPGRQDVTQRPFIKPEIRNCHAWLSCAPAAIKLRNRASSRPIAAGAPSERQPRLAQASVQSWLKTGSRFSENALTASAWSLLVTRPALVRDWMARYACSMSGIFSTSLDDHFAARSAAAGFSASLVAYCMASGISSSDST